jgi:isoleucyl-tRNA synthetase
MLGTLAHFEDTKLPPAAMPELERLMLHRLAELDGVVREAYAEFDYKKVVSQLTSFMTTDLSAFYFDVRKDVLYCDPISSPDRRAALMVIDAAFRRLVVWLAPILVFTSEEAWLSRAPDANGSVHLALFPDTPAAWRDDVLAGPQRVHPSMTDGPGGKCAGHGSPPQRLGVWVAGGPRRIRVDEGSVRSGAAERVTTTRAARDQTAGQTCEEHAGEHNTLTTVDPDDCNSRRALPGRCGDRRQFGNR